MIKNVLLNDGHEDHLKRLDDPYISAGFDIQMPCRLEHVSNPTVGQANIWLDVCHNEQGLSQVLSDLAK